jgi:hypothetical protein
LERSQRVDAERCSKATRSLLVSVRTSKLIRSPRKQGGRDE